MFCSSQQIKKFQNNKRRVFNYIFSHVEDGECLYLTVSNYNCKINALLDSGANRIFFGKKGIDLVHSLGLTIKSIDDNNCTIPKSESMKCTGVITVPICLESKVKIFEVYLVP